MPEPTPESEPVATPAALATPEPTVTPTLADARCELSGTLETWHRVELLCDGPDADEADSNTFLNHRFNVVFAQGKQKWVIPGHFAADGDAKRTGATKGNKWRAYFSPPAAGDWNYTISFHRGEKIALSSQGGQGSPVAPLNGLQGTFLVAETRATGRDMKGKGLLLHARGERYLRHAKTGAVFIEGGMDSPENIFGYDEFDNTKKFNNVGSCKGILHSFADHEADWNNGPTWGEDQRGKNLIGLINYIAGKGVNAAYIMANTVNGDGCDAHPWTDYSGDRLAYDISKLDQWEVAFSHMNTQGLLIHFVTQETENDHLLDGGELGEQRQLFYREMISRFAHHPALQWNLGEENTNTSAQIKAFADHIKALDAYQHPVFMHTFPDQTQRYDDLLGHASFDGPTLQFGKIPQNASAGLYGDTIKWLKKSQAAGNTWVVTATEASGDDAPTPDKPVSDLGRIYWTWANIMAGGGGIEWYLKNAGSAHAYDLSVENLREFDELWAQTGHAMHFFNDIVPGQFNLNLQSFSPNNAVTALDSDWVLADAGRAYIVFLREGGSTDIQLPTADAYQVHWFNPRTGDFTMGELISGPGTQAIGLPPSDSAKDWAALIVNTGPAGAEEPLRHPDIVRIDDLDPNTILQDPRPAWADSYSVGDKCYCQSTFDHDIGNTVVDTNAGMMTVREACDLVGAGPGAAGRPRYNDIQCGNGPANGQDDEDFCPGRIDIGKAGCGHIGPLWQLPAPTASPMPIPARTPEPSDGRALLFADDFNDGRPDIGDGYFSKYEKSQAFPIVDGVLMMKQISSSHGSALRKMIDFKDIDIEFDFRFDGEALFSFVLDDDNEKSVWASHISRAMVTPNRILVQDDKTGSMNLAIREKLMNKNLPAKERAELDKLLESKRAVAQVPLTIGQWYRLRIYMKGDLLEAFLDGKSVTSHHSIGFDHPTKTKFGWTITGSSSVSIDNLKVYKVE